MKTQVRWKRIGLTSGIGVLAVLATTTAYADWKWRQGICVNFNPDGSEEILYGEDCGEPELTPTTQGEDI